MATISHATMRLHKAVVVVVFVALLAVGTAVTLTVTIRGSGGSPSTPTPVAHHSVAQSVENCMWRRNGWYC
jgi:hypothetical protein